MRNTLILGAALAASFLAANCGSDSVTCDESGTCAPNTGDGGGPDGPTTDGPITPEGCEPTADPKDAPKCVVDSYGVFVDSVKGDDANAGTMAAPAKTIMGAIGKLSGKSRVYVCAGTYAEHVKLTSAVSLYGGFVCGTWTYDTTGASKPKVIPSDAGYALELATVSGVTLEDFSFEALAGVDALHSSIAIFANGSSGKFARLEVTAHDGLPGTSGTTMSNYDITVVASSIDIRGHDASGTKGGTEQDCTALCNNSIHSTGGKGGDGSNTPTAGEPGKPDRSGGLAGAVNAACVGVGVGGIGGPGNLGTTGDPAGSPATLGSLTEQGWMPADGEPGKFGGPGQGGGGGGGKTDPAAGAGGGGGCGGCGGAAGVQGEGGGGSIGVLAFMSTLAINDSTISTGGGGAGGAGSPGQAGQIGGNAANMQTGGCQGGAGAGGGPGGSGSGGSGGISAGILYKGPAPTTSGTMLIPGAKGVKGIGGTPNANDGVDGQSITILAIQ